MSIKKVLHEVPNDPAALATTKWYVEDLVTAKPQRNIVSNGAVDGADSNTAIQTTINELNSLGGGVMLIPNGTFRFTSLTWYSNIHVVGVGPASILDYRGTDYASYLSGTNNVSFSNLKIVGSNAASLSGGFFINNSSDLYFDNIIMKGFSGSDVFILSGAVGDEVNNILFNKLIVEKQTGHTYSCNKAFNIDGTSVYVKNVNIANSEITYCESDAVYVHAAQGISLISCNVNRNKGYAVNLASNLAADGTYIYGVSILGGVFQYNNDALLGEAGDHSTNTPFNSNSDRTEGFVALGYRNFDPNSRSGTFGQGDFIAGDDGIIFSTLSATSLTAASLTATTLTASTFITTNITTTNISGATISAGTLAVAEKDIDEYISDNVYDMLSAGPNIALTYDDPNGIIEISGTAGGGGTVTVSATTASTVTIPDGTNDYTLLCDCGSNDVSATMPDPAVGVGRIITLKKINSMGEDDAYVLPNDGETLDGESSITIETYKEFYRFQADGTNWHVIGYATFLLPV